MYNSFCCLNNQSDLLCACWISDVMSFDSIMFCYFRYGLPVNFHAVLMQPHKKHTKKLHELLNAMYSHLDTTGAVSKQDVSYSDIPLFFSSDVC